MTAVRLLIVLSLVGAISADSAAQKQATITRIKNLLTSFLTDRQLSTICDTIANGVYNGDAIDSMTDAIVDAVLTDLTGDQMTSGLGIYLAFSGKYGDAMMSKLGVVGTVATNNLSALLQQVKDQIAVQKAAGKGKEACLWWEYNMLNQFLTPTRVKTILGRLMNKMNADDWTFARKQLGDIVKFSKYGF